jgi:hypothetical protein
MPVDLILDLMVGAYNMIVRWWRLAASYTSGTQLFRFSEFHFHAYALREGAGHNARGRTFSTWMTEHTPTQQTRA